MTDVRSANTIVVAVSSARGLRGIAGPPGTGTVDQDLRSRVVDFGNAVNRSTSFSPTISDAGTHFRAVGTNEIIAQLPSAIGSEAIGKVFPLSCQSSKRLIVTTVEAGGGIEDSSEMVLVPGERVILVSDGATWRVEGYVARKLSGKLKATAQASIASGASAQRIVLAAATDDISGLNLCWDQTNRVFKAARRARYQFTLTATVVASAAAEVRVFMQAASNMAGLTGATEENAIDIGFYRSGDTRILLRAIWSTSIGRDQIIAPYVQIVTAGVSGTLEYAGSVLVPTLEYVEI